MFQKREVHFVPGMKPADLWPKVWDWWSRQGFQLTQTAPTSLSGTSFYSRIGLRRELWLVLSEAPNGCNADLALNAQVTDEGLVLGAVSAVVFLPVAVVGGAISYSEYETDARNLMLAFWQYVYSLGAPLGTPPPQVPEVPTPCAGCGSAMLPDWKVCPYCGRARSSPT
ncbi:MAG TPA: zinc ribbon domain-containing protein [Thermoplasmata archaeon]|nr:zinc ribbon domain-containing protein [Thermoplasmata archaeon]